MADRWVEDLSVQVMNGNLSGVRQMVRGGAPGPLPAWGQQQVVAEALKCDDNLRCHIFREIGPLCMSGLEPDNVGEGLALMVKVGDVHTVRVYLQHITGSGCKVPVEWHTKALEYAFRMPPSSSERIHIVRSLTEPGLCLDRMDIVYEGSLFKSPAGCVVSFPGKYAAMWNSLTVGSQEEQVSSACVFLPRGDPRNGKHAPGPGGKCWCHSIYGFEAKWGCKWFECWKDNVQKAVDMGLQLVVVFFDGQCGQGIVDWNSLPNTNLWNAVGLGGSQKGEVAWLRKNGWPYLEVDAHGFTYHLQRTLK